MKKQKLLKKYLLIIFFNLILWIGILILALIKANIYVI